MELLRWLVVTGEDRADFLQGQLSNDINALTDDNWQLAAYCSPQGKVLAVIWLWRNADEIWLGMAEDIIESVQRRLKMFVLRSRVSLEQRDVPCMAVATLDVDGTQDTRKRTVIGGDSVLLSGTAGVDVFIGSALDAHEAIDALRWRASYIRSGIAQVHAQTADTFLPQALGLDHADALSFTKGCYVGQENVARLHYKSQTRRHLAVAETKENINALPGDQLRNASQLGGVVLDFGVDEAGGVVQAVLPERLIGTPLQLDGCDEVLYFKRCYESK